MKDQPLFEVIRNEIIESPSGMISFRRFMECCLYHPRWGYYCKDQNRFGKKGDFFTNVQVGALFGQILARAFLRMRSKEPFTGRWALVEMGAGDGQLMLEVISFFHEQSVNDVDFYVVEKRGGIDGHPAVWVKHLAEIPRYPFAIIFSNELVDAFPVHQIEKKNGKIEEIFVTWNEKDRTLQPIRGTLSSSELCAQVASLEDQLEDGQICEVNLAAKQWLQEIAEWLSNGYVYTIDYGGETEELLLRKNGTIRCFQKHQLVESSYLQPGDVDITASVNFTWLREWGDQLGLDSTFYGSQTQFILTEDVLDLITDEQKRNQLKQLIHPAGMGEVFRVLIQKKSRSSFLKKKSDFDR